MPNENTDLLDRYTEKTYNNYGWVRANNVLTASEYQHFNHSFSDNKNLDFKFTKNPKTNETIIPTGDNANTLNVLVYVKGTFSNPLITKVVKINSNDSTDISIIRSDILDNESRGSENSLSNVKKVYGDEYFSAIEKKDMRSFWEYQRESKRSISTKNSENSEFNNKPNNYISKNSTNSRAGVENTSAFSNGEKEQRYSIPKNTEKAAQQESKNLEEENRDLKHRLHESEVEQDRLKREKAGTGLLLFRLF